MILITFKQLYTIYKLHLNIIFKDIDKLKIVDNEFTYIDSEYNIVHNNIFTYNTLFVNPANMLKSKESTICDKFYKFNFFDIFRVLYKSRYKVNNPLNRKILSNYDDYLDLLIDLENCKIYLCKIDSDNNIIFDNKDLYLEIEAYDVEDKTKFIKSNPFWKKTTYQNKAIKKLNYQKLTRYLNYQNRSFMNYDYNRHKNLIIDKLPISVSEASALYMSKNSYSAIPALMNKNSNYYTSERCNMSYKYIYSVCHHYKTGDTYNPLFSRLRVLTSITGDMFLNVGYMKNLNIDDLGYKFINIDSVGLTFLIH